MATSDSGRTLFDENKVGDLTLKNRVVLAPLTRSKAGTERVPNALMAEYYQQRAGAGLVITEATTVSPQGNGYVNTPGIYTEEQSLAWRPIVDAVHGEGGLIFLQLWHTGRASHSDFHDGELPVSASALKIEGDGVHTPEGKKDFEVPRALDTEEIPGVVADYVTAAKFAKAAGFDGVEIHSANGYLLDQFLQSSSNKRTDAYGGSVENRFRLLREVVEAVVNVMSASRVGLRLSPNGMFNGMGSPDFRETFLYVAKELSAYKLAYLHVMDGLAFGFHELGEPITLDDIKEVYSGPVMGNCGYNQESAAAAVKAGSADLIAFGRPYITNPDLVERFRNQWPLTPDSDPTTWYLIENPAEGYTSYSNYAAVDV
ncbi:MAG: N-ethylmaleimide reductase [Candidatus Krumholzibacteriia bacterium]|jgi:N-ethylmaleimide reductase